MNRSTLPTPEVDYTLVFQGTPTPLLILSPQLRILGVNDAYLRVTLARREDILGRMTFEAFPENSDTSSANGLANVQASLNKVRERKVTDVMAVQRYDVRNPATGEFEPRYWCPVNTPVLDASGELRYIIHRVEDVTALYQSRDSGVSAENLSIELQLANQRLRETNEALEQERDMREQFVLTLSHDLRTPLAAARMAAQLLLRKLQTSLAATSLLGRLVANLDRADQMIQNLLDANRLRAGKPLPLKIEACELRTTVQQVLDELATLHGDRFVLEGCKVVRGYWCCRELSRLVENLCTNGVKHGAAEGRVRVVLSREGREVCLVVHSEGEPIPPDELARLFEPFHRAQQTFNRRGWGLGLTLVKGIAQAHGGRVEVHSSAEAGTMFRVYLPVDARR